MDGVQPKVRSHQAKRLGRGSRLDDDDRELEHGSAHGAGAPAGRRLGESRPASGVVVSGDAVDRSRSVEHCERAFALAVEADCVRRVAVQRACDVPSGRAVHGHEGNLPSRSHPRGAVVRHRADVRCELLHQRPRPTQRHAEGSSLPTETDRPIRIHKPAPEVGRPGELIGGAGNQGLRGDDARAPKGDHQSARAQVQRHARDGWRPVLVMERRRARPGTDRLRAPREGAQLLKVSPVTCVDAHATRRALDVGVAHQEPQPVGDGAIGPVIERLGTYRVCPTAVAARDSAETQMLSHRGVRHRQARCDRYGALAVSVAPDDRVESLFREADRSRGHCPIVRDGRGPDGAARHGG